MKEHHCYECEFILNRTSQHFEILKGHFTCTNNKNSPDFCFAEARRIISVNDPMGLRCLNIRYSASYFYMVT